MKKKIYNNDQNYNEVLKNQLAFNGFKNWFRNFEKNGNPYEQTYDH